MYPKGSLGFKTIRETTPYFDMTGMLMPFFINNGNNSVMINHTKIAPKSEFRVNLPFELTGGIPIKFLNDNTSGDPDTYQVNVYYGQAEIPKCT